MRRGTRMLVSLVLVGMLLSVAGTAWAEESAERGGLRGQVVAIEGDSLLVATPAGEQQVVITHEETRFRIPGVRKPSISDIEVGDYLGAWGQRNEDGDLVASVVIVVPAELARRGYVVQGLVAAVDGFTITVETGQGERTVVTQESTRFLVPGLEEPGIGDISAGDPILALGRSDDEGKLLARVVVIVTQRQVRRHTIRGVIRAIDGDNIGLLTRRGEVRVETNSETVFRIPGVEDPGIDDLHLRDLIVVVGTWDAEEEVFSARAVTLIPRWPSHLRFLHGEVTAIDGRTIVLNALQGELAVLTDGDTVFRIAGVEEPGLDDLEVGDTVGVLVGRTDDGGLLAKVVLVRRESGSLTDAIMAPVKAAVALLEGLPEQASGN
jgi:RNase P/RNase MRP subunit p29